MTLREVIKLQGKRKLITIKPDTTIREAMETIVKKKIGALLISAKKDDLVGIITERDILWRLFKEGELVLKKKVEDLMTKKVIVGVPDDELEVAEKFMTVNRFRHLPVMEGNKLIGIISIGDLVKSQLSNLKVENRYLTDYITGKYPA